MKEMEEFYQLYESAIPEASRKAALPVLQKWVTLAHEQTKNPFNFEIYHKALRAPFDYYQFGLDLIRPLVDLAHSRIFGLEHAHSIQKQLNQGENAILLANHQTEPDTQLINLLLTNANMGELAERIIFVAGHRVVTDPWAIPLSLGCNLLCVHSKKYIEYPAEEKSKKIAHNRRTIKKMGELLKEGGHCIFVALSGGRDRMNESGQVTVAPFSAESLELFALLAQQSGLATHFYPLSLRTHDLMPPPRTVQHSLGEKRTVNFSPIYLNFGKEIPMENRAALSLEERKKQRLDRAEEIWRLVSSAYSQFPDSF